MKICTKCKIEKSLEDFQKKSNTITGTDTQCKSCRSLYKKQQSQKDKANQKRRENRLDEDFRNKINSIQKLAAIENPERYLYHKAKGRAMLKNLEFNIEVKDIIIPKYCPILEIELTKGKYKDYQNSPSIDRIDSSKGYIKGNIQVISVLANTMKNTASKEQLEIFCKNILKYC